MLSPKQSISNQMIFLFTIGVLLMLSILAYGFLHVISPEGTLLLIIGFLLLILLSVRFYLKRLWNQRSRYIQKILEDKNKLDELIYLYEFVNKATYDVIWDYDLQSNKLNWMPGFEETYGYSREDYPDDFWAMSQVFQEDRPKVQQTLRSTIAERQPAWLIEYRYICANGTLKYVRDRGHVVFNEQGEPIRMIGAMQDVDQQRKYEEQLLNQNKQLREIAWINSHEVRRPLSNIIGLVALINESAGQFPELQSLIEMLSSSSTELDEALKRINEQTEA